VWDLTGNVWEWTACRWRSTEAEWRHGRSACHRDDLACLLDERRVRERRASPRDVSAAPRAVWGGSWIDHPKDLRAARRDGARPHERDVFLGFRLKRERGDAARPALSASRLVGCGPCRSSRRAGVSRAATLAPTPTRGRAHTRRAGARP
jgi:hypothetical protein